MVNSPRSTSFRFGLVQGARFGVEPTVDSGYSSDDGVLVRLRRPVANEVVVQNEVNSPKVDLICEPRVESWLDATNEASK